MRDTLVVFAPPKGKKDSYLEGNAVRVTSDRGVVTFGGLHAQWPEGTPTADVRDVVDDLTHRRILRRGLLLGCPDCSRRDFFPVDELAQTLTCTLCGADIPLVQSNWKDPVDEPRWFYDAHPTARSLVPTNSDVPLLTAHHLGSGRSAFSHIGEVELVQNGRAVAETDLIGVADDQVIVVEAKSNTDLASGGKLADAIAKRVTVAQVVRADQIVLATTGLQWPPGTVAALQRAIDDADWFGAPPRVRVITNLRRGKVGDQLL